LKTVLISTIIFIHITVNSFCQVKFTSNEIYLNASPSVVRIEGSTSIGSGFFMTSYLILTNNHVVENQSDTYTYTVPYSKKKYSIKKIICTDELLDLAVIEVEESGIPLKFASSELSSGSRIYSIGNPMGLSNIISEGLFSGNLDINGIERMQFNAAISPGSSGGPILNEYGGVVGLNVSSLNKGQNINFGVCMKDICSFLIKNKVFSSCYLIDEVNEISKFNLSNKKNTSSSGTLSFDTLFGNCIIILPSENIIVTGKLDKSSTMIYFDDGSNLKYPFKTGSQIMIRKQIFIIGNKI
jgi:hypothetical protein